MTLPGPVVEERVVRLRVRGEPLFEWRCTPQDIPALVAGRLFIEGMVTDGRVGEQLVEGQTNEDIEVEWDGVIASSSMIHTREPHVDIPSDEQFAALFRALFAGVDERHESGGMHAAALATAHEIVFQAEDVGRHNAIDKVVGMALIAGADITRHGLLTSSRVSGEIARKAARSGAMWLASRSIPTTLAVRIATAEGLPIIGRAAGKHAVVYS